MRWRGTSGFVAVFSERPSWLSRLSRQAINTKSYFILYPRFLRNPRVSNSSACVLNTGIGRCQIFFTEAIRIKILSKCIYINYGKLYGKSLKCLTSSFLRIVSCPNNTITNALYGKQFSLNLIIWNRLYAWISIKLKQVQTAPILSTVHRQCRNDCSTLLILLFLDLWNRQEFKYIWL